jgi:hypothetical protein
VSSPPVRRSSVRRRVGAVPLAAAAVVPAALALYLRTMPPTITWWFGGADSGDLVSAAATLGIPHPTGYPLFVVLGYAATRVPLGEVAARVNAMNALLAALGAGAVVLTVADLARAAALPGGAGARAVAGALAALAVAVSGLYWTQAIIGEVYALHAALAALLFWLWARPGTHAALRGAAHGLALANHATALILLAAAGVAFVRPVPRRDAVRVAAWFLAGLAAPLLLYLLLPVRAAQGATANWGDPDTPGRFLAHITARPYAGLLAWHDPVGAARETVRLTAVIATDLPPWVVPAAALGLARLWRTRRRYAAFTSLVAGGVIAFAALYRVPDRLPYLLPAYVAAGVWSGCGLLVAADALQRWTEAARGAARMAVPAAAALLLLVLAAWAARTAARADLHGDDSAVVFARAVLEPLPPGATYVTARDDVTFALWYAQRVLGVRRDVRVVDARNPGLAGVP